MSYYDEHLDSQYYVGRKYHRQLMKVLWKLSKYLLTKLSIPDIHDLEDAIVMLERIYEEDEEQTNDEN